MRKKFDIKSAVMKTAGLSGGVIAGAYAANMIPVQGVVNPLIRIVIGAALPNFVGKSPIIQSFGDGMCAGAGAELANEYLPGLSTPATEGLGSVYDNEPAVNGTENVN
jgi:hypothetical protein